MCRSGTLTRICLASSLAFSRVRYTLSDVAPADVLLLALPRLGCDLVSCKHTLHPLSFAQLRSNDISQGLL